MSVVRSEATPSGDLAVHGIETKSLVHWNYSPVRLIEEAIKRGEGELVEGGAFNALTSPHTGRSPKDRYVVREPETEAEVWWGEVNAPLAAESYEVLRKDLVENLARRELFVRDMWSGVEDRYRVPVRIVTPSAWHNLFAHNMFRRPESDWPTITPSEAITIFHDPDFQADTARHATRSGAFIVLHLGRREVLIGGTKYAGEIKKSVFSMMNFLLPRERMLPMHCSANVGEAGDVAVFFGLSGTGKTTLSADPERHLIGDDEHGWSDDGIFNLEGGCYAKVINLSESREPEIFSTTRRFGTILENVDVNDDGTVNLESDRWTENTRGSYPIAFIPGSIPEGSAGHPRNIVFLTADAFGVLPPISRLTPEQAMFHFLSGYTAKVAGTERGVTEPMATFSTCFGAPFLPLPPSTYAAMLGEKVTRHDVTVWLVNTGWTGGPYGTGRRIDLEHTRAMIHAALEGRLDPAAMEKESAFGLLIPTAVPGVPSQLLRPREAWSNPSDYDAQAAKLGDMFVENFSEYEDDVSADAAAVAEEFGG
ncbi:MAG: phosphoenolpyruvate carboxykinase (ATP) [Gemmatimonas sp.]|nr:phosphoenolpyruvate carboxykinase (ATP) [Gemmatimonas sp.]